MKVGIVADAEFANSAALLTAELSKDPGAYEMLERDAVDRVLQEQGLAKSGATAGDWAKAGHLLAADGLVLLQKRTTGNKETTNVGWILSVNTSVVLGTEILPKAEKEQLDVLKALLERCRAKVAVKAGEAVPLSIIPAETAGVGFDADREIFHNGLMLTLMREPSVFVLQREQLETVLFERDFAGASSQGFWGGANIVQCRVGPDPLDKGTYAAALSLKRRDGSSENWIQKAKTPQELAAAAANGIRERLKLTSTAAASDLQSELAYFRKKLKRLYFSSAWVVIPQNSQVADTAITLQALGENDPFTDEIAVFSPLVKVCGGHSPSAIIRALNKKKADRKTIILATQQLMENERGRLQKLASEKRSLGSNSVTDFVLFNELIRSVTSTLSSCSASEDTSLQPELSALRRQMRDYLKLSYDLKWYLPHTYLVTYGEFFFDDTNEWLDNVEALFGPPFNHDPLYLASRWLQCTIMEVPREQRNYLRFTAAPIPGVSYSHYDPKTIALALPRMKRWASSKEPGLRFAGARVLLRGDSTGVDKAEMARIVVQALGEMLPAHCRSNGPSASSPKVYNSTDSLLLMVEPLAHKELLDLSIRTLEWAERVDMAYLLTQPANKEEAVLLGQAYKAAAVRLRTPPKGPPFDKARRAFPEAFADDTPPPQPAASADSQPQVTQENVQSPVKTAKLIWPLKGAAPLKTFCGPEECEGKLWYVIPEGQSEAEHLTLVGIDLQTKIYTTTEIPIQQRERFFSRYSGDTHFDLPSKLLINDRYAFMGHFRAKGQKDTDYWMIFNRKTRALKEVAVPTPPLNGGRVEPPYLLLGDKIYWLFGVEHPEKSRGLMVVNAVDGSWKYHPFDLLKDADIRAASEFCWNRERNTLALVTSSLAAEFDLQRNCWLDARPAAAGEALIAKDTAMQLPEVVYNARTSDFSLKTDPALGTWNVSVIDPATHRRERFVVKVDVEGLALSQAETKVLLASDKNSHGMEGGQTRSGLWFRLENLSYLGNASYTATYKTFWLPWSEIRTTGQPPKSPDLLFWGAGQILSTDSNRLGSVWKELSGYYYEFFDRNAESGSVLVENSHPPFFLWGHREQSGAFVWRVPTAPDLRKTGHSSQSDVALSPDGMGVRFIASNQHELREWRAENGQDKLLFTAPEGETIRNFAYAPDGISLAWAGLESLYWQPASGKTQVIPAKVQERPMRWSADGKYLAVRFVDKMQILERVVDGLAMAKDFQTWKMVRAPNSSQWISLARIGGYDQLQLTDISDGTSKALLPEFKCHDFILSADGKAVVASGTFLVDQTRPCILRIPLDGGPWKELAEGTRGVDFLPISKTPPPSE